MAERFFKACGVAAKTVALWLCVLLLALAVACAPPAGASSGASGSDDGSQAGSTAQSGADDASGDASEAPEPDPDPPEGLYAPADWEPQAPGVIVVNEETGLAVYEKNADGQFVSGSLVKMMTCILAVEFAEKYGRDLDTEMVQNDKSWIYDELYGKNASTADIRKGEVLSMRELLYAALLPSANEAALLLASHVCGGYMPNFMYQMNTRASSLGCTGTYFAEPNGLSEENVTTARDMAKITRAFMSYPVLVEIAATPTYEMAAHEAHAAPYNIFTTNRLMVSTSPYYKNFSGAASSVIAGKTGSLGEWQNFASKAAKNGESYVCVVLNSPNGADTIGAGIDPPQARPALVESAMLYEWAFENLTVTGALDTTLPAAELRVKYSTDADTVLLMPADDIKAVLEVGGDPTALRKSYSLPEEVPAPVRAGAVMGTVTLSVAGQEIGSSVLTAARDINRNPTLYLLARAGEFLTGLYLRVLIVVVLVFAAGYAGIIALAANSRARKRAAAGRAQPAAPQGPRGKRPATAQKQLKKTASPLPKGRRHE